MKRILVIFLIVMAFACSNDDVIQLPDDMLTGITFVGYDKPVAIPDYKTYKYEFKENGKYTFSESKEGSYGFTTRKSGTYEIMPDMSNDYIMPILDTVTGATIFPDYEETETVYIIFFDGNRFGGNELPGPNFDKMYAYIDDKPVTLFKL